MGALLLLLGSAVSIFHAGTMSGSFVLCSRGPATGGKPPGGTTRSLLLLPRALPRAAAGTGGAGERTMILKVGPTASVDKAHLQKPPSEGARFLLAGK